MDHEIELHLALRAEQLMIGGRTPEDARAEALRRFGPFQDSRGRLLEAARQREATMNRRERFDALRRDVSFAFRTFGRQKGWTAVAVGTLALGIGAATAVFSVVSSLVLHAVPYPHGDRVVVVSYVPRNERAQGASVAVPMQVVRLWQAGQRSFDALVAHATRSTMMATTGEPVQVWAGVVQSTFADFAGIHAIRGRMFTREEQQGNARVVLLSEQLWRGRFGAKEDVLGRSIRLSDSSYVVIGVLPAAARLIGGASPPDLWIPLDDKSSRGVSVMARLESHADPRVAERELDSLAVRGGIFGTARPPVVVRVVPPSRMIQFRDSLMLLSGAVALVLLVACTNVAHLLVARGVSRRREFAVRSALGAGRGRLLRQLVTEGLVLCMCGAIGGLLLGRLAIEVVAKTRPANLHELDGAGLDGTTLTATLAVTALLGCVFGLIGALEAERQPPNERLKAGSLALSGAPHSDRLRSLLVVSEMAVTAVLLVGASLLIRSVINVQRTALGFEPAGVHGFGLNLPTSRYPNEAARASFIDDIASRLHATLGVEGVALSTMDAYGGTRHLGTLEIEGVAPPPADTPGLIDMNAVQASYFRVMRIRFVEGATFTDTSAQSTQVIVNEGFARRHWPVGAAVGHRIRILNNGSGSWMTVVGVAADALTRGIGREATAPFLYHPWDPSSPYAAIYFRVLPETDPAAATSALIHAADPRLPPVSVWSAETVVREASDGPRFTTLLLGEFTIVALVLAAIGLYGTLAYTVSQRTREIGVRVALGATQWSVGRAVIGRGLLLAISGATIGLGGAFWATRLLRGLLYGVAPLDLMSFVIGAGVLLGVAVAACVVPVRRALSVDVASALRAD